MITHPLYMTRSFGYQQCLNMSQLKILNQLLQGLKIWLTTFYWIDSLPSTTKNNQRTDIFLRHRFVKNMYHVLLKSQNRHRPHKTPDGTRLSIRVFCRGWWKNHWLILRSTWSAVDSLQESGSEAYPLENRKKRVRFVWDFLTPGRIAWVFP